MRTLLTVGIVALIAGLSVAIAWFRRAKGQPAFVQRAYGCFLVHIWLANVLLATALSFRSRDSSDWLFFPFFAVIVLATLRFLWVSRKA